MLHFQWTGSDANNNNNAGNGRAGTDRSNLVQALIVLGVEHHLRNRQGMRNGISRLWGIFEGKRPVGWLKSGSFHVSFPEQQQAKEMPQTKRGACSFSCLGGKEAGGGEFHVNLQECNPCSQAGVMSFSLCFFFCTERTPLRRHVRPDIAL